MNKTDVTIETYDSIVDEYVDYFKAKGLHGVHLQKETDYFASVLREGSLILDAGTATGDYAKFLTEGYDKNFSVMGIDASKNMIERAKVNAPKARFQVMDIRDLEFGQDSFDAIMCFATLQHIDDESCLAVLDKFDDILKDSGVIAINVLELDGDKKESFEDEPLNSAHKTYFNFYTKQFFVDFYDRKGYKTLKIFDEDMPNPGIVGRDFDRINKFTIVAEKGKA
jgi:ubiquinone/menaquinone biosynthesis C-methylase UbiE